MSKPEKQSFLFATFEGGGSVAPMLTIVEKLAARGHHVRLMSDACNRPECEASGAHFVAWQRAPSRPGRGREFDTWDDWSHPTPQQGLANILENLWAGPARAYAEDVVEELHREPADLVVSNEMLFGVPLGCEAIGQRIALLAANIPPFPMEGFLPFGPGLLPPTNDDERRLVAEVAAESQAMLDHHLPAINSARRYFGLAPLAHVVDQHKVAEHYFIATSRAFDFAPAILPPQVTYVGPQLGEPKWAAPWSSPFATDDDRPLVLVAFSTTFQDHAGVLQRVIAALETLPVKAVVTLGGSIRPEELCGAANVAIVESAPHHAVMREAALVVTHGGHGTVMKALANGLPLLIVPHGRDQVDNGVRVATRAAGLVVDRHAETATFRAALQRLLDEASFGHAARDLGAQVARDWVESPVVRLLEDLAWPRAEPRSVMPAGGRPSPRRSAPPPCAPNSGW